MICPQVSIIINSPSFALDAQQLSTRLVQVVKGQQVVDELENVPKLPQDKPAVPCIIYDCGRMTHEEGQAALSGE
jgi:hypothetical protein